MVVRRAIPWMVGLAAVALVAGCSGPTSAPAETGAGPAAADSVTGSTTAMTATLGAAADAPAGAPAGVGTSTMESVMVIATPGVSGTLEAAPDTSGNTPDAAPGTAVEVEPISAVTETLTYVDDELGYAIDYPASWSIDHTAGTMVMLTSFDMDATGHGGMLPGDAKIDIVPDLSQVVSTLSDLVAQGEQTGQVVKQEQVKLAGGVPAVLMYVNSAVLGGDTRLLVTVIGGRGIRVQGYGELDLFNSIALSLRPVAAAP